MLEGEPEEAEKPAEGAEGEKPADDAKAEAEKAAAELAAAKAEAAEWKDKFMRLHAEWDTYRRRTNEQREAEKARAAEKLVTSLLPVIDDFERTIDYAEKNGEGELLGGVRAVHSKFVGVLEKDGVEVIDPTGEAFDALEAQAVATVPDTEAFDETVHEVYQKGYRPWGEGHQARDGHGDHRRPEATQARRGRNRRVMYGGGRVSPPLFFK